MKIKITHTFEPEDFKGSGQMVIRNSCPVGSTDLSFAASVAYKVGWTTGKGPQKVTLISLADGMVCEFKNADDLCDHLNTDSHGFRPMTDDEIKNILGYQGNRFPKT